ncbi:hypothetical protein QBC44DRAFT_131685 [Cladorrhinum sp. PSN332]|nr:hypothetical protein QBC44DRAFT_131685 [Cladorrhinum sp. PSN332]
MPSLLLARYYYQNCTRTEDGFIDEDSCYVPFWNTKTGIIVKWSLFLGFLIFSGLYLLIGYIHAKKRIQKGLAPLGYHRFLVPRATLARVDPRYRFPQANIRPYAPNGQQAYDMYSVPPPPVYDPNAARPPMYMYEPPVGSTKVDYNQQLPSAQQQPGAAPSQEHVQYAAPLGPPPPPVALSTQQQDTYAPPPGPPPPSASTIQQQGTGNTNPFRS